ncbi:MAG: hypothetical protein KAT58_00895 [candidate division Zixibacteria bacterium]|nr:hypothetical protein [candidate division Zixibacteria bacterium]
MPGINLYCTYDNIGKEKWRSLEESASLLRVNDRYSVDSIYRDNHSALFFAAYSQYPRSLIEDDKNLIFVEGCVYNKPPQLLEHELRALASTVMSQSDDAQAELRNWLLGSSGEFVLVFINKASAELAIVTDVLGQLPLSLLTQNDCLYLSRELKFIVAAADQRAFDRHALAEFLTCSFPIGEHTIIKDVQSLPQACLLRVSPSKRKMTLTQLHCWNPGTNIDDSVGLDEYAKKLVDLYVRGTRDSFDRLKGLRPVLGLSGGLDSRAALAALSRLETPFVAETGLSHEKLNTADYEVAQQVAKVYGCNWRGYLLGPAQLFDMLHIVFTQTGTTSIVMAGGLNGFRMLVEEFDHDNVFVTGDGGFLMRRSLRPPRPLKTIEAVRKSTIGAIILFNLPTISKLLRLKEQDVLDAFCASISSYPQSDLDGKYSHFQFVDRPRRLVMEGSDRTRFFYWLVAPLWNTEFFKTIMQIPDQYKSSFKLYARFLKHLDEKSLSVPYANIGARLGSPKATLYGWAKNLVAKNHTLYQTARRVLFRKQMSTCSHLVLDAYLKKSIHESELLPEYFDIDILRESFAGRLPRIHYYLLATVVMTMIQVERGFPRPEEELARFESSRKS